MAARRPLVVIDGIRQELPAGDTVIGASGGGGSSTQETATIDLGSTPINETMVTVPATGVLPTSYVQVFVMMDSTADNTQADHHHAAASWKMTCLPGTDSFDLYIDCLADLCWGTFKIRYVFS
jgi:hypothetical protein